MKTYRRSFRLISVVLVLVMSMVACDTSSNDLVYVVGSRSGECAQQRH